MSSIVVLKAFVCFCIIYMSFSTLMILTEVITIGVKNRLEGKSVNLQDCWNQMDAYSKGSFVICALWVWICIMHFYNLM